MNNILFPSVRDLSVVPPVISAINYLATFEKVSVFSYYINDNQFDSSVKLYAVSVNPYPKRKLSRVSSKLKCFAKFYIFLYNHAREYDYIWCGVWDYIFIIPILRLAGYKGKVIYQMNELEFDQLAYCRKVDYVVVPDENRGWIAYFLGKLKNHPFTLSNIPFIPTTLNLTKDTEIDRIRAKHSRKDLKILLYQGGIDYKKRCIAELLQAVATLPEHIILVVMPGGNAGEQVLAQLQRDIDKLQLREKVHIINTVKAPEHLVTIQKADLGIGLYRPISLNQIYAAPNRLYEFTKFGIPVILPSFPYFKYLSIKYPGAINTVDPESAASIAATITQVLSEPNYSKGRFNAAVFTQTEGSYQKAFDACWAKILLN